MALHTRLQAVSSLHLHVRLVRLVLFFHTFWVVGSFLIAARSIRLARSCVLCIPGSRLASVACAFLPSGSFIEDALSRLVARSTYLYFRLLWLSFYEIALSEFKAYFYKLRAL